MSITISQEKLNNLKAQTDALVEQWAELQAGIDFNVESELDPPDVPWFDEERRDVMARCTIMVYLLEMNLACYPLSESAALFVE